MPTFQTHPRFDRDWKNLAAQQRERFRRVIGEEFQPDLVSGHFRPGLRVKGVLDAPTGVFEMTWAPDGRAAFEYGKEQRAGETHIIWRRIGSHDVFRRPL